MYATIIFASKLYVGVEKANFIANSVEWIEKCSVQSPTFLLVEVGWSPHWSLWRSKY